MGWACGTYREKKRRIHRFCWKIPEGKKDNLADIGVGGRIILKSIFNKSNNSWTGLIWLRRGASGRLL
jgi:hypothetical protein